MSKYKEGMSSSLEILKALSDRNRLRIVAALMRHEELVACQITELLQVTGATASRHLSLLTQAGILTSRKEGRWVVFQLVRSPDLAPVLHWLEQQESGSVGRQEDETALEQITGIDREELCRMQRGDACCPRT